MNTSSTCRHLVILAALYEFYSAATLVAIRDIVHRGSGADVTRDLHQSKNSTINKSNYDR